jgi:hypothetical protein
MRSRLQCFLLALTADFSDSLSLSGKQHLRSKKAGSNVKRYGLSKLPVLRLIIKN